MEPPKTRLSQGKRLLVALILLAGLVALVLAVDALRGALATREQSGLAGPTQAPGSIAIRLDGKLAGSFAPADLDELHKVSFVDAEEGKTQEGWLLRDVLLLHLTAKQLRPGSTITVSSTSGAKSAQLAWSEVQDPANWVMFDLSGRGTLKLVSTLPRLDTRDEWVQDVDRIEVATP